jgi:hypothetical protein
MECQGPLQQQQDEEAGIVELGLGKWRCWVQQQQLREVVVCRGWW